MSNPENPALRWRPRGERPTEPGGYWIAEQYGDAIEPGSLRCVWVQLMGPMHKQRLCFIDPDDIPEVHNYARHTEVSEEDCKYLRFAGPIEEPQEGEG